ncbi:MAG: PepSY-like domain-containing protein [Bacteroidales bacterium]|nr:PepSY-like domain-containing protein [Bacteroidales bacterium]
MKRIVAVLSISFLVLTICAACSREHTVTVDQLPQVAEQFIKTHFSEYNISAIMKDFDSYEVIFSNGYKIEFDRKGNWEEVDCVSDAVPTAILPAPINNYMVTSFADNFIVDITKDKRKYEAELNNGIDLEFDKDGNFLRIDD